MRNLKRMGIACALVTNGLWALTGCLSHNGRLGAGGGGDDGSVLASIGGISDADKDRPFTYELVCGSVRVKGEGKADKDFARFPGKDLKNGDECALEIRVSAEEADKLEYEWYGVKAGTVDVGLFYGSDLQKINGGKLALTLYSLAAPIVDNSFTVKANIKFEAGATIPAEGATKASLVCGETEKYPGDYKKAAGELDATLVFTNLQVKLLEGKSCTSVAVLVDNVVAFAGDTADLKIAGAKKGGFLTFPDEKDETKRYTVKAVVAGGGDVDVTANAGNCVNYVDSVCKDVRTSSDLIGDLPFIETYVIARIQGKTAGGQTATFLATARDGDFISRVKTKSFNVTDMNESLKNDAKKFYFFRDLADADLLKQPFDANFINAKTLTVATPDELKDFKVTHFAKILVHGTHKVDEAALNAAAVPAIWLTHVRATKDAIVSEFFVSGNQPTFLSTTAPLAGKFFDFAKLAAEMATPAGSDKWKVYAIKGGAMAASDCIQVAESYTQSTALFVLENLTAPAATGDVAQFGKCEVSQAKFDQTLATGYAISPEHYLWEWFVPTK